MTSTPTNPTTDGDELIRELEAEIASSIRRMCSTGYTSGLQAAITIVRRHYAGRGEGDVERVANKALLLAARWFKLNFDDYTFNEHPPSKADLAGMFDAMQEARQTIAAIPHEAKDDAACPAANPLSEQWLSDQEARSAMAAMVNAGTLRMALSEIKRLRSMPATVDSGGINATDNGDSAGCTTIGKAATVDMKGMEERIVRYLERLPVAGARTSLVDSNQVINFIRTAFKGAGNSPE